MSAAEQGRRVLAPRPPKRAARKFAVAQLGSRMHYAVPRILYGMNALSRFYTDICAVHGWPRLLRHFPAAFLPSGLRRLRARVPTGVDPGLVTAFTNFGLEYAWRARRSTSLAAQLETFLWAGKELCRRILLSGLGDATGLYTFDSAALELLTHARSRGMWTCVEQAVAPRRILGRIMQEAREAFPEWEDPPPPLTLAIEEEFGERQRHEWASADLILCGSEFVRDGIRECGGPAERCAVVPYGVDVLPVTRGPRAPGQLRVLTVGEVGLRKGSPYVLGAARLTRGLAEYRMVGPISVRDDARKQLSQCVQVLGPIPRSEIQSQYAWADVFLLPSLCEGSATVTYEALAHGLPVVTTHSTGSVVRDGLDGFVVPERNAEAIAEKLTVLASDLSLRRELGSNATRRATHFSVARYAERLSDVLLATNSPDAS